MSTNAWMLLAALLMSLAGMGWLALAMTVHWEQACGGRPLSRRAALALRAIGVFALLAALALCLRVDHGSMASLVWIMTLAIAAMSVAMTLAWRPGWLALLVARRPPRQAQV